MRPQFAISMKRFRPIGLIAIQRASPITFAVRVKAYEADEKKLPLQAITEYGEALESLDRGDFRQGIVLFTKSMKSDPDFLWAANNLAWLLATCSKDEVRNGKAAVTYAKTACQKSDWHCWSFMDTLAASFAEAGEFDYAVECGERALMIAPTHHAVA